MTSDAEIVKAIKENIKRQNEDWKLVMGRTIITKEEMLKRIDRDKAFRKLIVRQVLELSIDILSRKPE